MWPQIYNEDDNFSDHLFGGQLIRENPKKLEAVRQSCVVTSNHRARCGKNTEIENKLCH